MDKIEILSKILARIEVSTEDLKEYDVDPEEVSSVVFLTKFDAIPSTITFPLISKYGVPFLGVSQDYFDQYLEMLGKNGKQYQLFQRPYRHAVLTGAKFAIRDDYSFVKSRL